VRVTFHVKVDNCALVAEDAAATVADKLALLHGSPDVFLGGGAVKAEHGDDIVGRSAAMFFTSSIIQAMNRVRSLCVFGFAMGISR